MKISFLTIVFLLSLGGINTAYAENIFSPNTACTIAAKNALAGADLTFSGKVKSVPRNIYRVYDERSRICATTPGKPKVGDKLRIGIALTGEVDKDAYKTIVRECTLESDGILINEAGFKPEITLPSPEQNSAFTISQNFARQNNQPQPPPPPSIAWFPELECFSENISLELEKIDGSEPPISVSIPQYQRYRAGFQIGYIDTSFVERGYGLSSATGSPLIYEKQDNSKGPEYVVSVLVYGLPHYFTKGGDYKGRDVVNEQSTSDKTSLLLSIGVGSGRDVFGIGIGYEIVKGINLTVSRVSQKVKLLGGGYASGDEFAGTESDIPIRSSWENDIVFGVSIDARYLANFLNLAGRT